MSILELHDLPAPAKLNLFLHVIGRRPDGYHLLQSIFVLIDWADTLHLTRRDDGLLQRHDLGPALPRDDLCLRAAQALQAASGTRLGADIAILKSVPWGAGMGGGSSDAATVLLGLNRLWQLGWPRSRLLALGATLGADVPFFIGGQNAMVEGIGERLTPMTLPPLQFEVVKPAGSISTAQIFSSPLLTRDTDPAIVEGLLAEMHCHAGADRPTGNTLMTRADTAGSSGSSQGAISGFWGRNDLQAAAEALCPEVSQAAMWLQERHGNSRMTGSGSAVFAGIGMDERPSAAICPADGPEGWVVRRCRSLAHHPLVGWAD